MTDELDHECERCDAKFKTNAELQAHRQEVHGDEIRAGIESAKKEVKGIERM